jgi:hypothetical protein
MFVDRCILFGGPKMRLSLINLVLLQLSNEMRFRVPKLENVQKETMNRKLQDFSTVSCTYDWVDLAKEFIVDGRRAGSLG